MAHALLLVVLCSLWSGLVWLVSQWLLQRYQSFGQWPGLYWGLALLCFVPLMPMPEFIGSSVIPAALLQDTLLSVQQMAAQPQHQGLLSAPLPMALLWQSIWLLLVAISLYQLGRVVLQWRQLQLLIRSAQPVPAAAVFGQAWPAVVAQLPQLNALEIRQTHQLISPFVAGWQKMVLVLPPYIWGMSITQRQLLIRHELIHLQRCDPQQLLLWRLLVAICWFNPILRLLEQAFIRQMELTVDQKVLATQPTQALLYGQTLLQSLKHSLSPDAAPAVSGGMPGFIQANADQHFYQQRLTQLFRPLPVLSARQRWMAVCGLCGIGVLLKWGSAFVPMQAPLADWRFPLAQVKISSFYAEVHPFRQNRPHLGVDFAAGVGVPVLAAQQGKVLIADDQSLHPRFGKVVLIDHGQGYQTLYSHLDQIQITVGSRVATGQPIGTVGETGRVTGPHLHFELLLRGESQDPMLFLK